MVRPARRRKTTRLKGYDYAQPGAYFVTVCVQRRECLLGSVVGEAMQPSVAGKIAEECWRALPEHYGNVQLDAFTLMPNHLHGIVILTDDRPETNSAAPTAGVGAGFKPAPTGTNGHRTSLSEVVRGFKTFSARRINELRGTPGAAVWQRSFYEHVIRSEHDLVAVREYIGGNPPKWAEDQENPDVVPAAGAGAGLNTAPARPPNRRGGFETRPYTV